VDSGWDAEGVTGSLYRGHRFPKEIISWCVWLYFRFGVSFRDVEEMMAARGVLLSYETVRRWCEKFGRQFAAGVRRRRARTGDKWHLDEVFLKINGVTHYLWRAVDQNGGCSRHPGATQTGSLCCHPVLSQAVAGHRAPTARDRYRQAAQLCRGETNRDARRCSSTAPVPEQPGRELTSTDTGAGEAHATL
jgi:hypothetical protein